jgi:hypothetical protein
MGAKEDEMYEQLGLPVIVGYTFRGSGDTRTEYVT